MFYLFIISTHIYTHGLLQREMQETLKMIQWPLISTNQEVLKTVPPPDVMSKFQVQFQCLGKLKLSPQQYI